MAKALRVKAIVRLWWIENNELHLNMPVLLRKAGLPDTEQNRTLAVEAAQELLEEYYPGVHHRVLIED